jgi:hypothetical protein
MSVKVSLKEKEFSVKGFPKLMIATDGMIVFFVKVKDGIVLCPEDNYKIGEYEKGFDMSYFKDYEGEITLKNE